MPSRLGQGSRSGAPRGGHTEFTKELNDRGVNAGLWLAMVGRTPFRRHVRAYRMNPDRLDQIDPGGWSGLQPGPDLFPELLTAAMGTLSAWR